MIGNDGFVHLNVHTEFSLQQSIVRIKPLMKSVKAQIDDNVCAAPTCRAMPAVALTDLHNLFALVKFYRSATEHGLKPLVGVDARISLPNGAAGTSRLLLLAQNTDGYHNLTRLVSRAYQEGQSGVSCYRARLVVCRSRGFDCFIRWC